MTLFIQPGSPRQSSGPLLSEPVVSDSEAENAPQASSPSIANVDRVTLSQKGDGSPSYRYSAERKMTSMVVNPPILKLPTPMGEEQTRISIATREGDRISISYDEAEAEDGGFTRTQGGIGVYRTKTEESRFLLEVDGELNDTEREEINTLLGKIDGVVNRMLDGDMEGALREAMGDGASETLADFQVDFHRKQENQFYIESPESLLGDREFQRRLKEGFEERNPNNALLMGGNVFRNEQEMLNASFGGTFEEGGQFTSHGTMERFQVFNGFESHQQTLTRSEGTLGQNRENSEFEGTTAQLKELVMFGETVARQSVHTDADGNEVKHRELFGPSEAKTTKTPPGASADNAGTAQHTQQAGKAGTGASTGEKQEGSASKTPSDELLFQEAVTSLAEAARNSKVPRDNLVKALRSHFQGIEDNLRALRPEDNLKTLRPEDTDDTAPIETGFVTRFKVELLERVSLEYITGAPSGGTPSGNRAENDDPVADSGSDPLQGASGKGDEQASNENPDELPAG